MCAALSQLEYLQKKYEETIHKIHEMESNGVTCPQEYKDLLFQAGKLYSEIELLKRVPAYEDKEEIIVKE
jgi:hypothetical protein